VIGGEESAGLSIRSTFQKKTGVSPGCSAAKMVARRGASLGSN